jgi:hypothetical protein
MASYDRDGYGLRRLHSSAVMVTHNLHFLVGARNRHPVAARGIPPQRKNMGLELREYTDELRFWASWNFGSVSFRA